MSSKIVEVLNNEDVEFLKTHMKESFYEKGQTIFSPNDCCRHLSIVLKGQVKISKYNSLGKEQIISFLDENDVFGEALVFNGIDYPVYVIAEKDSTIGMIEKEVILQLTARNTEFTKVFFEELSSKILMLNNKVELLSYSNIKQRLAFFLIRTAKLQGSQSFDLPHAKQKIANLLSTSREVISRNFSDMEAEGYIQSKGKKITIDMNKLNSLIEE